MSDELIMNTFLPRALEPFAYFLEERLNFQWEIVFMENIRPDEIHARVLEGIDSFKSAHMRALHF